MHDNRVLLMMLLSSHSSFEACLSERNGCYIIIYILFRIIIRLDAQSISGTYINAICMNSSSIKLIVYKAALVD